MFSVTGNDKFSLLDQENAIKKKQLDKKCEAIDTRVYRHEAGTCLSKADSAIVHLEDGNEIKVDR